MLKVQYLFLESLKFHAFFNTVLLKGSGKLITFTGKRNTKHVVHHIIMYFFGLNMLELMIQLQS